ncbi:MAG: hypothetical protein A2W99_09495 [Bacteroidetes bacterium GWF2_33_16]|nr:MAG: hypothetical protein A2X00_06405 [Bacteroidetes bacterium GWE2_32_14]OFY07231.1 MAG: hypothetical protein A2W99_09495 [Bacteroidetes bacterium GWF2_33_16]
MTFRKANTFVFFVFVTVFLFTCTNKKDEEHNLPKDYKQKLEKINKVLIDKDAENIQQFINRRGWEMNQSQSGLRYMIYKPGNGKMVKKNDLIKLNYKTWLIDGSLIYSSDSTGAKIFRAGQGGVEAGLEEGVLLLDEGCKARLILPPHLAHGLIGDGDKIPGRAIIVYDIELVMVGQ